MPQTVAEQVHREECRRCSISGLLMLIWRALMGPLLGASCGYRKTFRGPRSGSRSLQIRPKSVRPSGHPPVRFFFRADFGARKWNSSRGNEKKDVQKSDIALITWSRLHKTGTYQVQVGYISGTHRVHIRYTYGTYQVHSGYTSGTWVDWLGQYCLRRRRNLPRGFILVNKILQT